MEAREYFKESGDIDGTLRQLPRHLVAERAIVSCFFVAVVACKCSYFDCLRESTSIALFFL